MDFKLIGGIFLVVGTSIGAGMLALPIVTAELGFLASLFLLLSVWFVMTCGALFLLEANLWLPKNSNLVSMAKATIGPIGQLTTWIIYLLLLYSLLCAYIAGGSDLFQALLAKQGLVFSPAFSAIIFTVLLSSIVYLGIHFVDYANRGLMIAKFIAYFILIILLVPFIHLPQLAMGNFPHISQSTAITITVTSFGFASIVPSLRFYFDSDVKKLKKVIIFGGLIPLFCYIAWDAAIMGIIPIEGAGGLADILTAGRSTSGLVDTLNSKVSQHSVSFFVKFFTSICVLTSFLGVALCLFDFIADGLQLEKIGKKKISIYALTFFPPLALVMFFPNIFIKALEYSGIYCVFLFVFLPAWMVCCGRKKKHLTANLFKMSGGTLFLGALMMLSVIIILHSLLNIF